MPLFRQSSTDYSTKYTVLSLTQYVCCCDVSWGENCHHIKPWHLWKSCQDSRVPLARELHVCFAALHALGKCCGKWLPLTGKTLSHFLGKGIQVRCWIPHSECYSMPQDQIWRAWQGNSCNSCGRLSKASKMFLQSGERSNVVFNIICGYHVNIFERELKTAACNDGELSKHFINYVQQVQ